MSDNTDPWAGPVTERFEFHHSVPPLVASGGIPMPINIDYGLDREELRWNGEAWEFVADPWFGRLLLRELIPDMSIARGSIRFYTVPKAVPLTRRQRIAQRKEQQKRARRAKWLRPFRAVKRGWKAMINKRPDFDEDDWDDE